MVYIPKERLCIGKLAQFRFHAARETPESTTPSSWGTFWMVSKYPPEIQDWIKAHAGIEKMPLYTYWIMWPPDLWAMGYRRCAD